MIAYAFWHWPSGAAGPYEDRLRGFHAALRAEPPRGFIGVDGFRCSAAAWLPGPAYLDWYRLQDFAALEKLNEAAVTASRRAPHDVVAALAAGGSGAIYRHKAGPDEVRNSRSARWFGKTVGVSYDEFIRSQGPGSLWMRQMVLGASPEFVLFGGEGMQLHDI